MQKSVQRFCSRRTAFPNRLCGKCCDIACHEGTPLLQTDPRIQIGRRFDHYEGNCSRPKDLEDIRTIADKSPNLDRKRIEVWVRSFGEVLELPDLWDQIKFLLE